MTAGRISKAAVHHSIDIAADHLKEAAGPDGKISRADMKKAGAQIEDKTEKKLTQVFAKFADHRDFRVGAQLTAKDVDLTAKYAKAKLIDAYDTNRNGLEKKEISKMSLTGQLAVLLAKQNENR